MATTAFIFTKDFKSQFARFQKETGGQLKDMVNPLMGLLIQKCYEWTLPKKQKDSIGSLRTDINRVLKVGSDKYIARLHERFGTADIVSQEMRVKDGKTYTLRNVSIAKKYDLARFDSLHASRRKAGRVTAGGGKYILTTDKIRERYIKHVKKRVGKEKAGWTAAMDQLGARKSIPAWVRTAGSTSGHSGPTGTSGAINDQMRPDEWSGFIEAYNLTSYAKNHKGQLDRAHQYIEKYVAGKHMQKWLDDLITRENAKVTTT